MVLSHVKPRKTPARINVTALHAGLRLRGLAEPEQGHLVDVGVRVRLLEAAAVVGGDRVLRVVEDEDVLGGAARLRPLVDERRLLGAGLLPFLPLKLAWRVSYYACRITHRNTALAQQTTLKLRASNGLDGRPSLLGADVLRAGMSSSCGTPR